MVLFHRFWAGYLGGDCFVVDFAASATHNSLSACPSFGTHLVPSEKVKEVLGAEGEENTQQTTLLSVASLGFPNNGGYRAGPMSGGLGVRLENWQILFSFRLGLAFDFKNKKWVRFLLRWAFDVKSLLIGKKERWPAHPERFRIS
jgi:hypothetical protein